MNRKNLIIVMGIAAIVAGAIVGLQIPLKRKYDELVHEVNAATKFVAHPIDAEARAFLTTVTESWKVQHREKPDSVFLEISMETGFQNSIEGVVNFHTHKIPPYSFLDPGQNKREGSIAAAMAIALPISTDGLIYHGDEVCFVKLTENLVEVFQDGDQGVSRTLYMKTEDGGPDAAEESATPSEANLRPDSAAMLPVAGAGAEVGPGK